MMHICHHREIELAMRALEKDGKVLTRSQRLRLQNDISKLGEEMERTKRVLTRDQELRSSAKGKRR